MKDGGSPIPKICQGSVTPRDMRAFTLTLAFLPLGKSFRPNQGEIPRKATRTNFWGRRTLFNFLQRTRHQLRPSPEHLHPYSLFRDSAADLYSPAAYVYRAAPWNEHCRESLCRLIEQGLLVPEENSHYLIAVVCTGQR